jgi:hypothetical protein
MARRRDARGRRLGVSVPGRSRPCDVGFPCRCLVGRTRRRAIHGARARHPCLARSCQQDTGKETSSAVTRLTVQRSRSKYSCDLPSTQRVAYVGLRRRTLDETKCVAVALLTVGVSGRLKICVCSSGAVQLSGPCEAGCRARATWMCLLRVPTTEPRRSNTQNPGDSDLARRRSCRAQTFSDIHRRQRDSTLLFNSSGRSIVA